MKPTRTKWGNFPNVSIIETDEKKFRQHHSYSAAKTGDVDAALTLVRHYVCSNTLLELAKQAQQKPPILVAVQAVEGLSVNVIPEVYAAYLSSLLGWPQENSVLQINRVGHTKSSGFHRMATPALFAGDVRDAAQYFIVDDFIGQGGTLANMRGFIEQQGGIVTGISVLAGKPYSAQLKLQPSTLIELRNKHGDLEPEWLSVFGYGYDFLTESEARYLVRTEDAHRIRTEVLASA